ncbi:hypothetical protein QJV45_02685 [Listeria booriae]|uniref:hypothetical protein n=1 Tax=Listeria booriae TaxID=1552123 RepID=UPI0028802611|nr:hypothetical protein [Listeria booriae]MDT0109349.1 hypothetical protein [Listeria booriae]
MKALKIVLNILIFLMSVVRCAVVLVFTVGWVALSFTLALGGFSSSYKNYNYR